MTRFLTVSLCRAITRRDLYCFGQVGMLGNQRMSLWKALALSALFCASCGGGDPHEDADPREVVKGFLLDVETQNNASVWKYLGTSTRAELDRLASEYNARHASPPRRGEDRIRTGHVVSSTREYRKFELVSETETESVVEIVLQDETRIPVTLHRESDRWALDLPVGSAVNPFRGH